MGGTLLFAGLGNPGPAYAATRHNVGWMVLDRFAEAAKLPFDEEVGEASIARGRYAGTTLWLVKPLAYVNRSGRPLGRACGAAKVTPKEIVVIHDDLDLPPGRLKLQRGRGAGGHNGVTDVIDRLGSNAFTRLRFGIGRPGTHEPGRDYVLEPFDPTELADAVEPAIGRAVEALKAIAARGITAAMNDVNRRERELARGDDADSSAADRSDKP